MWSRFTHMTALLPLPGPGRLSLPTFVLLALGLGGCGVAGGLGQAKVAADCEATDDTCVPGGLDAPLAVGATAMPKVAFSLRGTGAPSWRFESADPSVLLAEQGRITGVEDGVVTLMVTADDGTVFDFFHVWVKQPTEIALAGVTPGNTTSAPLGPRIDLLPGEALRLSTSLVGDGQSLVGDAPQTWKITTADGGRPPIALLDEGAPHKRRVVAVAAGKATLTVTALSLSRELDIVVADPTAREAAGSTASLPTRPAKLAAAPANAAGGAR